MKIVICNYKNSGNIIPEDVKNSVVDVIKEFNYRIERYGTIKFRNELLDRLMMKGWSGKVNLSMNSNISITSIFKNIGLCIQTGNMARMYADLMKLQAMYMDNKIKAALFILPVEECSRSIGSNAAKYERLLNELTNIFSKVITIPMIIIGFNNDMEK
ncbi:MAG: hypothetical protein IJU47_08995 [Verrucomicrobia bacterium]|nr:hypothetical protein [Verrucomicrobiota bacterium]